MIVKPWSRPSLVPPSPVSNVVTSRLAALRSRTESCTSTSAGAALAGEADSDADSGLAGGAVPTPSLGLASFRPGLMVDAMPGAGTGLETAADVGLCFVVLSFLTFTAGGSAGCGSAEADAGDCFDPPPPDVTCDPPDSAGGVDVLGIGCVRVGSTGGISAR